MEEVIARLRSLTPIINEICRLSGCPGASIGVLHQRQVIYTQGFGYRDVERKLPPDEHTIYYLASLSKAFTAAMVGMLVEQGKMEWTTPVFKMLPTARHFDATIREQANMVDWMSHRTGLAPKNHIWSQEFGHYSLKRKDAIPTTTYLEKVFEFRTQWLYSNWGYALADEVVTKLSGQSWGTALKTSIFDPLRMDRTITEHDPHLDNVAEAYMALANGKPYHVPRPFPEDGKVMEGAVAVQSNVRDLLIFYKTVLEAAEDQLKNGTTSTPGNPLKQIPMLVQGHIPLDDSSTKLERSYGLGWIRTELPGTLGVIGLNPRYTHGNMPIVGKGLDKKQLCMYHQGSTNSFLSSVHLLPDSQTAIVVLTNSLGNNDTADWLGELLLETVLDNKDKNNYTELARNSSAVSSALWPAMKRELDEKQVPNTAIKPLESYVGKYYNIVGTYFVEIIEGHDALLMCFQGDREQLYELDHYNFDVFSWLLTRNEDVRRGRFPVTRADFYLMTFKTEEGSESINSLVWCNDPCVPEGETFWRRGVSSLSLDAGRIEGPA